MVEHLYNMRSEKQLSLTRKSIGKIIRVTRKQLGLSQATVANALALQQSALSRIESGQQELGASDLVAFCNLTSIPIESFYTGHVELITFATLKEGNREFGFRLPPRYANSRGSKVRAMLPFLKFAESAFGPKKFQEYIRSKGVDPDFFVNLDNQISVVFCLDVTLDLIGKGLLAARDIHKITDSVNHCEYHGILHHQYDHLADPQLLLNALLSNAKYYECNFKYEIAELKDSSLDILVTPEAHMPGLLASTDAKAADLLCHYKKNYFRRFTSYGGQKQAGISELSCYFKGDSRCIYRLKTAA